MPPVTNLSYEAWLDHAFGHEVRFARNPWFFDTDSDWWDPEPATAVDYLTRLFTTSEQSLAWFADAQIAQGLTYLLSTSASGDNGWLYSRDVPTEARLACIRSIFPFFEQLFAARCAPALGHLSEEGNPLNTRCYMWWDEFPCIALPDDPDRDLLNGAALDVMRQTLVLDSPACQESALHGLGHWARYHPAEVEAAVDAYLADSREKRPELLAYAQSARCGCVL
jgi:hypothetical protein